MCNQKGLNLTFPLKKNQLITRRTMKQIKLELNEDESELLIDCINETIISTNGRVAHAIRTHNSNLEDSLNAYRLTLQQLKQKINRSST